jgi:glycosyltransferase involved in cell wall biosynthesis
MGKNSDEELEKRIKAILGDFDLTVPPPKIAPVPKGVNRPTWSVMIPTYNCAKYLTQTLESVLEQDPGPEHMQIEVVDDCSTLDDPEKVVWEVGKGRVAFHRNPQNSGCCTFNFNICIRRSIGHLVHILHGDDWIGKEFFKTIDNLALNFPCASLYATRVMGVNSREEILWASNLLESLREPSHAISEFSYANPLQFAGVVVRRSAYEQCGGFLESLLHTADWEMWVRIISIFSGVVSPRVLAFYRTNEFNDSGRLARQAENLNEILRLFKILQKIILNFDKNHAIQILLQKARRQELHFRSVGDKEAANCNALFWKKNATLFHRIQHNIKCIKYFFK